MFIIIPGAFNAQTGVPGGSQQGQVITVGSILKVTERDRRPYPTDVGTPSEIWIDNTAGIGYICKEFDTGHGTVWDRLDLLGDFITFGDDDPGIIQDIRMGYRPGSLRYARNSEILWICKDNTQGAAVWVNITSGATGSSISLPVPKVYLKGIRYDLEWMDYDNNAPGGTLLTMINTPHIVSMDLSPDILNQYRVFVEMVYYRRGKKAYVVPVPQAVTAGVATNTLEQTLGVPLMTRGGIQKQKRITVFPDYEYYDLNINRPNHYEVTSQNQIINVSDYFNGMFTQQNVEYNTTEGIDPLTLRPTVANLLCTTPAPRRGTARGAYGNRFAYKSTYQPLYVAFRYVAFDASGSSGQGSFISGPLSKIVTISNRIFPFTPQPRFNALLGYPTCITNPQYDKQILKCWFENRIP